FNRCNWARTATPFVSWPSPWRWPSPRSGRASIWRARSGHCHEGDVAKYLLALDGIHAGSGPGNSEPSDGHIWAVGRGKNFAAGPGCGIAPSEIGVDSDQRPPVDRHGTGFERPFALAQNRLRAAGPGVVSPPFCAPKSFVWLQTGAQLVLQFRARRRCLGNSTVSLARRDGPV